MRKIDGGCEDEETLALAGSAASCSSRSPYTYSRDRMVGVNEGLPLSAAIRESSLVDMRVIGVLRS